MFMIIRLKIFEMEFTYSVNKANALSADKEMELLLIKQSKHIYKAYLFFFGLSSYIFIFETSPLSTKEGTRKEQI